MPDPLAVTAIARLERMRAAVVERAKLVLVKIAKAPDGEHIAARDELSNLDAIRTELLAILRREGQAEALSAGEAGIVSAMRAAMTDGQEDVGGNITLKASARNRALASATGALDGVAAAFGDGALAIRRLLDVSEVAGKPHKRLLADVAEAIDTSFSRAKAAVETAIIGAYRAITVAQAESGAEATGEPMGFLYDGPEDGKNRPFCSEHLGIVYTAAALRRLDNGQGLPVETFAGGYRCRHRLVPIDLEQARAEGYDVVTR